MGILWPEELSTKNSKKAAVKLVIDDELSVRLVSKEL
jgi:hypothetical protein